MAPRADAVRNAERLVAAARELFAAEGTGVALDRVAKRAGTGNATLYRNFPTRGDLLIAVYEHEVDELAALGSRLLRDDDPAEALMTWLEAFVRHARDKRDLALAATDGRAETRGELFERWHAQMRASLDALVGRARRAGRLRQVSTQDVAALANGISLATRDEQQARRLLLVVRSGLVRDREAD